MPCNSYIDKLSIVVNGALFPNVTVGVTVGMLYLSVGKVLFLSETSLRCQKK